MKNEAAGSVVTKEVNTSPGDNPTITEISSSGEPELDRRRLQEMSV